MSHAISNDCLVLFMKWQLADIHTWSLQQPSLSYDPLIHEFHIVLDLNSNLTSWSCCYPNSELCRYDEPGKKSSIQQCSQPKTERPINWKFSVHPFISDRPEMKHFQIFYIRNYDCEFIVTKEKTWSRLSNYSKVWVLL